MKPGLIITTIDEETMEWHREFSPRKKKKIKSMCGQMWGTTMDSVLWNSEGISLVGFLERGATISSAERYVQTL
jgi:hypothetical protein